MNSKLKELLGRVETWPSPIRPSLLNSPSTSKFGIAAIINATADELRAIDEADRSGIATEQDVEAAFKTFRHEG